MSKQEMARVSHETGEQKEIPSPIPQQSLPEGMLSNEEFERQLNELRPYLLSQCQRRLVREFNYHVIAEDILQDVLVKAVRFRDGFRGKSSLKTWVTRILINEISDYFQEKKSDVLGHRVEPNPDMPETEIENAEDPHLDQEELLIQKENRERLYKAIEQLPEPERIALRLDLEGFSLKEICERLGILESVVRNRLFGARRKLEEIFGTKIKLGPTPKSKKETP